MIDDREVLGEKEVYGRASPGEFEVGEQGGLTYGLRVIVTHLTCSLKNTVLCVIKEFIGVLRQLLSCSQENA